MLLGGDNMVRKVLLWFGIVLILAGISLPLYVALVFDYSDLEWRPIDVAVNVSGRETRAEFTATRQSSYSVTVLIPVPSDTSGDDVRQKYFYACMTGSPNCHAENAKCSEPRFLRTSETRLNNVAQVGAVSNCSAFFGLNERGLFRDLFSFDAIPGRHYVITTKVLVVDAALARLGPKPNKVIAC